MNTYEIAIPNDRINSYKLVTFIILTLNFVGFGYVFIRTTSVASMIAIVGIILNAVPWLYYLLNKKNIKSPIIEASLLSSAFIWLYFGNTWMGILLIIFTVIGFVANKKLVIIFSEKEINYPSFPTKKYLWKEISNVIFKDDILTIDLKNNKLLQFNIEKKVVDTLDENGFNTFCKKNIEKNT